MPWRPVCRAGALAAAVGVTGSGLAGCGGPGRTAQQTAEEFATAWSRADTALMATLVDRPAPTFSSDVGVLTAHLHASSVVDSVGPVIIHGSTAEAPLTETFQLPGIGAWVDKSTLSLVDRSGKWLVVWSPATVDPALAAGQHLSLAYVWAPRAAIVGAGGAPLTTQASQVVVGLEGSRVKDPAHVSQVLEAAGATAAQATAALAAASAHPTLFEPVFTLSEARYQALGGNGGALHNEPGTVFQHTSARAAVTAGLAAHLVGTVGPVTAEELRSLGHPYSAGDVVGQSGIEAAYEKRLAGKPGGTVEIDDSAGTQVRVLASFPATPGTPVATGIDPVVQAAEEEAMAGVGGTAAVVAVRASTGEILASLSLPAEAPFDEALGGEFPPGSTFKILTSTALFEAGLSPSSPASCPPTATVDGLTFHNAEGDAPVSSLAQAFTESCNTAFVQLAAAHLQPSDFPAVAGLYGIGSPWSIGLPAFSGHVPAPKDGADLAAASIGQGSVVVSPLAMAMVSAAVASGTARSPQLVTGASTSAANPSGASRPVPPSVVAELRTLMASVVSSGTAAGTGLPPGTFAKTGTAEYGSGNPPPTDAWLTGYRGDVAFAMVVQDSKGNGGPVDGPVVAKFLSALPASYG